LANDNTKRVEFFVSQGVRFRGSFDTDSERLAAIGAPNTMGGPPTSRLGSSAERNVSGSGRQALAAYGGARAALEDMMASPMAFTRPMA